MKGPSPQATVRREQEQEFVCETPIQHHHATAARQMLQAAAVGRDVGRQQFSLSRQREPKRAHGGFVVACIPHAHARARLVTGPHQKPLPRTTPVRKAIAAATATAATDFHVTVTAPRPGGV